MCGIRPESLVSPEQVAPFFVTGTNFFIYFLVGPAPALTYWQTRKAVRRPPSWLFMRRCRVGNARCIRASRFPAGLALINVKGGLAFVPPDPALPARALARAARKLVGIGT